MTFYQELALFFITLIIFLVIDLVWLGIIAKERYGKAMKKWTPKKYDMRRAFLFYGVFIVGMLFFALVPAVNEQSLGIAMGRGLAYGLFTYATYGLTNWTVIDKWPTRLTFEDIAWGTFLGWSTATISYSIYIGVFT